MEAFLEAKKAYSKLEYKADFCISCGVCIPKRPYGIDIISKLEYTHFKLIDEWVKQRT